MSGDNSKRPDDYTDLLQEMHQDKQRQSQSAAQNVKMMRHISAEFQKYAQCTITEDYFAGQYHRHVFNNPDMSDDEKASHLLGMFEMMEEYALSEEKMAHRVEAAREAGADQELKAIFSFTQMSLEEISKRIHCPSTEGRARKSFYEARRSRMEACDLFDLSCILEKADDELAVLSALPFDLEVLAQARDFAEDQEFHNFARLLDKRIKTKDVPTHYRYALSKNPHLAEELQSAVPQGKPQYH